MNADPHQQAVYRWEATWFAWNRNTLSITACRKIIRRACRWYKVPHPTVRQHGPHAISFSVPTVNIIRMQGGELHRAGGKNAATALHEAAHHIAWHLYGDKIQDHGPTFLSIYLDLLVRAQIAPRIALEATARANKLSWKRRI